MLGTTRDGVLVVAATAESRSCVEANFARLLAACFEAAGATGRLATAGEVRGVEAAGASEAA